MLKAKFSSIHRQNVARFIALVYMQILMLTAWSQLLLVVLIIQIAILMQQM
ncbi:MAG: hypothetical protein ACJAXJ_000571 [Colwellia sp.]|jgi:hypothetical protein